MPIEVGIWRLGEKPRKLDFSSLSSESQLEEILADDISVIDPKLLLIGRQVLTAHGKRVDLLALDGDAHLVVMELKRDRTPRDVVAQLLDYGSWVRKLEDDDIANIFEDYLKNHHPKNVGMSLDDAFRDKFGLQQMPDSLNESHALVVIAGELDDSTERIIDYLAEEHGVAINAIFFQFFRDGDNEYLSRAWLNDPNQVEEKVEEKREKRPWNGEFYASFGRDEKRDWEEARKYGFFSAGGGAWYSWSLGMLEPGNRVWVNIPGGVGYVGVGIVKEKVVPIDDFLVNNGQGKLVPITSLLLKAANHSTKAQAQEKAEYFV